ncbi:RDD family protein [Kitasatospora sp. NPDC127059]|uniref:RDD family protein n=1 Tax=unclassified Kitasatospora TaxID=2633591 RepID=UPI003666BACF
MTDRPFAVDGDPAVAAEPGYYPDPSIPGFVRYWGGSAWVPGTSRPAPAEGEVLQPPRFATRRPAPDIAAAGRTVPPPVVPVPPARSESPVLAPLSMPVPVAAGELREAGEAPGGGDTGPVYLDQTTGGASFVIGPRVAEAIGGPVFRTVEPSVEEAPGVPGAVEASGWQADPQAQRGLMETGGAQRWVSWGVLPGALEDEEGRAEGERAAVAVEVAREAVGGAAAEVAVAVAPAVAVAVRAVTAPVEVVAAPEAEVAPATARTAPRPTPTPTPTPVPTAAPPVAASSAAALPVVRPAREAPARRRATAPVPAGLGRRLAARAVDTGVLLVVAVAAGIPLGGSVSEHLQQKLDQARMASSLTRRQVQVWLVDDVVLGKLAALIGILVFVSLVYEVLPVARTGQTFGKRLARIRVVDAGAAGARSGLSLGRSLLRWVVRQVGVVLLLGLVWPLFDRPARRGWQDRAARTRVVRG